MAGGGTAGDPWAQWLCVARVEVARKWEISENLHRADLTKLERDEQAAEWIRLTEVQAAEAGLSSQVVTKVDGLGRVNAHRPESGINAAARELGINRMAATRRF